jgi:hypothetical protein
MVHSIYNQFTNENNELKIDYKPLTQNDPLVRRPCLELNEQILGKTNYMDIEEAILETIKYFLLD